MPHRKRGGEIFGPLLTLLVVLLTVAGCGSGSSPSPPVPRPAATPFVCHQRVPAEAGECIREELEARGITPAAPELGVTFGARVGAPQCVDVSVYQGVPNFRAGGVRCVVIQTNDGLTRNPLFYAQVAAAKRAGIPWGVYTYLEGFSGAQQARTALSMSKGLGRTLGVWGDAEHASAYPQACSFTAQAHQVAYIVGVYGSPGTYAGGRCEGYSYPAEWGGGPAFPLPGYPASSVKLRQWCGSCLLAGFAGEVDRDEALGVLALARPRPAPVSPSRRRQLVRYWTRERAAVLHRYHLDGCRGSSTGPKCTALRAREHRLYLDIRRES
jgi:hypothetical protein